jgi:gamma-glutamyltranspeptidase/glutathione hydrolase
MTTSKSWSAMRNAAAVFALLLTPGLAWGADAPPVQATNGMVVTAQHLASDVGVEILKAGGNAVDAAVAIGYAQAVVNPCCGNIGGGGFMVLHLADGRDRFLNFRETAPAAATPKMYLDSEGNAVPGASLFGYLAVGVPGTVLGLETALREYGHLTRAQVMAPAIRLARDGFVLTPADAAIFALETAHFRADPVIASVFLHPDGSALQAGDRLVQPDLASTLAAIAQGGSDAFYRGALPAKIAAAARAGNGILTTDDFAAYTVTEGAPLHCSYRGYDFLSSAPPSSGGVTMCEVLDVLSGYDLREMGFHSAAMVHVLTEALRHAYLDRNTLLEDPEFGANPLDRLLSPSYAAAIRGAIPADKAGVSQALTPKTPPHEERPETTHYSVVDHAGNAVSVTYTVNGNFGAVVMAPGTGVVLNDEMDDFTTRPNTPNLFGLVQGAANAIAPGKRPLSSMAPTIVTKDGHVVLVLGSPGGSRIITTTLEVALNIIDFDMQPQEAVDAPRLHHQYLPDVIAAERFALSPDTARLLAGMGYKIQEEKPWGAAEIIAADPATGVLYGANDQRRPAGSAAGY